MMNSEINYPTVEKIIEYNVLAITLIKVKKADRAEVLSKSKLRIVLEECETKDGDIYDKAVVLFRGIIQAHPFASGNRRTAFIAVKDFLINNHAHFCVKDDPEYISVMRGIRERYYSDDELKEWIKHGKIRQFRR